MRSGRGPAMFAKSDSSARFSKSGRPRTTGLPSVRMPEPYPLESQQVERFELAHTGTLFMLGPDLVARALRGIQTAVCSLDPFSIVRTWRM